MMSFLLMVSLMQILTNSHLMLLILEIVLKLRFQFNYVSLRFQFNYVSFALFSSVRVFIPKDKKKKKNSPTKFLTRQFHIN